MLESTKHMRKIHSFVRRIGRMSARQREALALLSDKYVVKLSENVLNFDKIFTQKGPVHLEIGFGMGDSLLEMAKSMPDQNFIGIEVHLPGVGSLLAAMTELNIDNIRIYCADALEVLKHCIPNESLHKLQIFFPDPWPKKRHHKRRLIQPPFVELFSSKLVRNGQIHLATDWENYGKQMMKILSQTKTLKNAYGEGQFAKCTNRPLTKYEQRGRNLGHSIWELVFIKS